MKEKQKKARSSAREQESEAKRILKVKRDEKGRSKRHASDRDRHASDRDRHASDRDRGRDKRNQTTEKMSKSQVRKHK